MAILKLDRDDIVEQVRLAIGEDNATFSKVTDAQIVTTINLYGNSLPAKVGTVMRENGLSSKAGYPDHPMWHTTAAINTTGTETKIVTLPDDYSRLLSVSIDGRLIPKVSRRWNPRRFTTLARRENRITGYELGTASGAPILRLMPPQGTTGQTSVVIEYQRIPAEMASGSANPDASPKYHWLWVYGTAVELMAPDDPAYERYQQLEAQMLRNLVQESALANWRS